jgi:outer membrane protein
MQAARGRVTQAWSGYLPQISISSGYDRRYSYSPESKSNSNDSAYDDYATRATASQLIYDFGQTTGKIEQSRKNLKASQESLGNVASALCRDVKVAYLEVLKKKHLVRVNAESLKAQEKHLAQSRALYRQGLRPRIDLTKGQTEVSQAKLALLQARYSFKNNLTELENLMGGPPAAGEYELSEVAKGLKPPDNLKALRQMALEARQDLALLKSKIKAAQAGLKSVSGSFWPSVKASGSYSFSDDNPDMKDRAWQAGLTLNWDIFTGLRDSGRESEARAEIKRLEAVLRQEELTVTRQVNQSFLALKEAYEAVDAARVALTQARENLNQAEGRYKAGKSDVVELSDAQVLYTTSKSALVQATYSHLQAWAALEYATGKPAPIQDLMAEK